MLFIGTTAPLGSGGVWDSSVNSYPGYPAQTNYQKLLQGTVFSDVAGSLAVWQSGDGTHWDYHDTIAVSASTGAKISVQVVGPWLKLIYTNGGSAQSVFRLFATLNDTGSGEPG